jgi:hypothetical protein
VFSDPSDVKGRMAKSKRTLKTDKRESTLLVLFIPSQDRDERAIEQE